MTILYIDFETRSPVDLKKAGLHNYAVDPRTEVLCIGSAYNDDDVQILVPQGGEQFNGLERFTVVAHNASFELSIWNHIMVPRYGWPPLKPEQCHDTMAMAYAMSLPGSLENAAAAVGIEAGKDKAGHRLMLAMCKPKADGSYREDAESLRRLYDYCKQDVEVERELYKRLRPLSPSEHALWVLDHNINQRGIYVDKESIAAAIKIVEGEQKRLDAAMRKTTGNSVASCTAVSQLLDWIRWQGVPLPGVAKADVLESLGGELPSSVRSALKLRQEAGKSSTAKLRAMVESASSDSRIHNTMQFHGAGTGRWAGRRIQPHNMPRGSLKPAQVEDALALLRAGKRDEIELVYGPVLDVISSCLRGMITASPGHELVCCDFSAIEARVLAWLAGQEDVLEIFRGHGKIYEHAAAGIFGKPEDKVTKDERQIGKVAVLACFAPCTQVLTNNGIKSIVEVSCDDLLWDGISWIQHQGVVARGVKPVVNVAGTKVTPGHLMLIKRTWMPAGLLASNEDFLCHALATGSENLPWFPTRSAKLEGRQPWSLFSVLVAPLRIWSTITTSAKALQRAAEFALENSLGIGERSITATPTFARRTIIGADCLTVYPLASSVAKTPTMRTTTTTANEAFECGRPGYPIVAPFWRTWWRLMGGIHRCWSWIGLTSTKGTNRGTYGSSQNPRMQETSGGFRKCSDTSSNLSPVFDILNAGPNHRFTVVTDRGPIIAHNCGYGGGVGAFQTMARAYNVSVSDERADEIKAAWRTAHKKIVAYWYALEEAAIGAVRYPGDTFGAGHQPVRFRMKGSFLWCQLPSGRLLCYPYPKIVTGKFGKDALQYMSVDGLSKKWCETDTYGGKLAENVTQAVARDLLAEALVRLYDNGYDTAFHVHDEVVVEFSTCSMDMSELYQVENIMSEVPAWATGLPIAAEGWRGRRYRK